MNKVIFLFFGLTLLAGCTSTSINGTTQQQQQVVDNPELQACLDDAKWRYDAAIQVVEQEANSLRATARSIKNIEPESYNELMDEANKFEQEAEEDYLNDYNERVDNCTIQYGN